MRLSLRKPQEDRCPCGGTRSVAQRLIVDPRTLRRRYVVTCMDCIDRITNNPQQQRLRERRTRKDWDDITDPLNPAAIREDQMPEQYPGRPRDALRAFMNSDATRAVVPGVDVGTIQQAIAALGLSADVYAEQRDRTTVLRRIAA